MEKIAIIGTGIAGMGCAHFLYEQYDITVFEKNGKPGGHTDTSYFEEQGKMLPVDMGFIVCNNENYPLLMQLFQQLSVPLKKTNMSFSAHIESDNIEYSGSSISLLFAQRKNIFSPRYIRFLRHLNRFNSECLELLENKTLQQLSIGEYCKTKNYCDELLQWYLLPMSSALWSTPPVTSADFPALSLVRFFKNHGFLGLNTQFQWYTVDGGSEEYKKRLIAPFRDKIRTNSPVVQVRKKGDKMSVRLEDGQELAFDKVIIATHADQARTIIDGNFPEQHNLLQPFRYELNKATLHTDIALMPVRKKVWSSWNYLIRKSGGKTVSSCTYWMNSLQGVSETQNYFVTINDHDMVKKEKVIREVLYEHPVFTVEAMEMQQRLPELNKEELSNNQLFFCGSYFRYGFHEDAFMSAVQVAEAILGKKVLSH